MGASEDNAKNRLQERVQQRGGHPKEDIVYDTDEVGEGRFLSTVTVRDASGTHRAAQGGEQLGKKAAEKHAAAVWLAEVDAVEGSVAAARWPALLGDALIKLAVFLDTPDPASASRRLQAVENNPALAALFDRWKAEGAPELAPYAGGLGEVAKATVVEATLWSRYGDRVLSAEARSALRELLRLVDPEE
jgi:hypothetical protein